MLRSLFKQMFVIFVAGFASVHCVLKVNLISLEVGLLKQFGNFFFSFSVSVYHSLFSDILWTK